MSRFKRQLPNSLTIARLILAVIFFVIIDLYQFPGTNLWAANVALVIFLIAVFTDTLDGFLARRWDVTSAFGRIMDPIGDKVLIIGAFVYLASPGFIDPTSAQNVLVSGVMPWMVVIILAREIVVTGIRSYMESRGIEFGAVWAGKWKMTFQSVAIPVIITLVAHFDPTEYSWSRLIILALAYLTVFVTVISGLPYITKALKSLNSIQP